MQEDEYANIHKHLPKDSLLIFNNTKVVAARLLFTKMTGGAIELFCLEPSEQYGDITNAMLQKKKVIWHCLVGCKEMEKRAKYLVKQMDTSNPSMTLSAKMIKKESDSYVIELLEYRKPSFCRYPSFGGRNTLTSLFKQKSGRH
ncbi:MAG: S-adenosylmethionine:tRNA ribosyltransferase-isomerase [Bacteroidetes bacterium]|nr:S-adenosylmethionine:tRNA ribosyltransferase-isomerase [Bacteroidota bacterium]